MLSNKGSKDLKDIPGFEDKKGLKNEDNGKTGAEISIDCVAKLIDTRESGFALAWTTYSTAESAALTARRVDLAAAWKLTDAKARNTAIQTAGNTYSKAHKLAAQNYRDSVKVAHVAYETAKKTCKILPANDTRELVPTPEIN
jgi:hypothetical protein